LGPLHDLPGDCAVSSRGGGGLMAEGIKSEEEKAAEARRGPPRSGGGPGHGIGAPVEKPANFGRSAVRLIGLLRPDRVAVILVVLLTGVAVVLNAIGPYILARATDIIFAGFFGGNMPDGVTQEQAVEGLRARG